VDAWEGRRSRLAFNVSDVSWIPVPHETTLRPAVTPPHLSRHEIEQNERVIQAMRVGDSLRYVR
jgi:hypothetical protein